ncbi:MAG TPA: maleylpyruvate isomerase family mycothiol-dependent enzyme [Ornithinicoccus sp.]|nr:maleylpyruvate isomerase family mycothiol-dependent enzyme [Ornithinicoccus sp.]
MTDTQTTHLDLSDLYRDRAGAIGDLLATTQEWDAATPCEGWTVRDLVAHLIETQRDFLSQRGLELPTVSLDNPREAWAAHTAEVRELLGDPEIGAREYDGYFGPATVAGTMATFYGWDLLVHRWDLARALGADDRFTPEELDAIEAAIPGFGDALYSAGICAAPVDVPETESRQVWLLARLGRDAR